VGVELPGFLRNARESRDLVSVRLLNFQRVGTRDWLMVSFHPIPAEELLEERPHPVEPDPFRPRCTRRRKSVEVKRV
jgi:hypothetical protein